MRWLAVLCFRFPRHLTTRDLREVYDPAVLQEVLKYSMWAALGFGVAIAHGLGLRVIQFSKSSPASTSPGGVLVEITSPPASSFANLVEER